MFEFTIKSTKNIQSLNISFEDGECLDLSENCGEDQKIKKAHKKISRGAFDVDKDINNGMFETHTKKQITKPVIDNIEDREANVPDELRKLDI